MNDFPSLPPACNPAPSNAQRLQALHQQNAGPGTSAPVRAQSQPARPPAGYVAAQWNTQTQRKPALRGRGRGVSYASQVNAARHPQNNGVPPSGFSQPPLGRGRGLSYTQNAALGARNLNQARAVSTPSVSRELPASYQQNVKLNNHGIGYRSNSGDASGSTGRPQGDVNYGMLMLPILLWLRTHQIEQEQAEEDRRINPQAE